jgi:pimeloyl-ACP methyl ester carboxylesterase
MRDSRTLRTIKRHPFKVAVAAVAATLLPIAAVTAAPATAAVTSRPKPTIVLVHGAWADASGWSGEVRRLQHDGYTVNVAPNPLRGIDADSAYLKAFLTTVAGPIILVGHSYGGAVLSAAATGNTSVKALVYINAFAPDTGESLGQLDGADSFLAPAPTDPTSVLNLVPYPDAPAGAVDTYIKPNLFITKFANGVPRDEAAVLAAEQSPTSTLAFSPFPGTPAWRTIPSYYLLGTRDNAITPEAQLFMATRIHAHIVKIDAGHLSLISNPGPVTDLIEHAATEHR